MRRVLPWFGLLLCGWFLFACSKDSDDKNNQDSSYRLDDAELIDLPQVGSLQNPVYLPDASGIMFTRYRASYNTGAADLYKYTFGTTTGQIALMDDWNNVGSSGHSCTVNGLLFSSNRSGTQQIWKLDLTTYALTQVTAFDTLTAVNPAWGPSDNDIVFEAHSAVWGENGVICRYNLNTGVLRKLTDSASDCRDPDWSPRGDKIAYQMSAPAPYNEGDQWDIHVIGIDGSGDVQISYGSGDKTAPAISPDGEWVAYASNHDHPYPRIVKKPIDGSEDATQVSISMGSDASPSWSPDGLWIVFHSCEGDAASGSMKLYRISAE